MIVAVLPVQIRDGTALVKSREARATRASVLLHCWDVVRESLLTKFAVRARLGISSEIDRSRYVIASFDQS
jgi:hypothetical protein